MKGIAKKKKKLLKAFPKKFLKYCWKTAFFGKKCLKSSERIAERFFKSIPEKAWKIFAWEVCKGIADGITKKTNGKCQNNPK